VLHTDLGKWGDVHESLKQIKQSDADIFEDYDACIKRLEKRLGSIRSELERGQVDTAREMYSQLKGDLVTDIKVLRKGVTTMEKALHHIESISG
jgi:hypothetical protein